LRRVQHVSTMKIETVMKCQNILHILLKFNFLTVSWFVWYCLCM